ncbi:hypothetical protein [Piscinibacterium candidicorallinum]|uniref:Uncharacterized protein n=2 Tax=Piscinibacterium candidicorallinum TaxID=1793872 RepID=A0ABV7H6X1_9BURK
MPMRRRGRPTGQRPGAVKLGWVIITDIQDNEVLRPVRRAQLICATYGVPVLPDLMDAQLVQMTPTLMVLTGWERLPDNNNSTQSYGQTWWCVVADEPVSATRPASPPRVY